MGIKKVVFEMEENTHKLIKNYAIKDRRTAKAIYTIIIEQGIQALGIKEDKTTEQEITDLKTKEEKILSFRERAMQKAKEMDLDDSNEGSCYNINKSLGLQK